MSVEDRVELLDTAKQVVSKDRNSRYGEPENNFQEIADIWNAQGVSVDGRAVTAIDVSLMMIGMKLARLRRNPMHHDSWADTAGYAACGWDMGKAQLARDAASEHANGECQTVLKRLGFNDGGDPNWVSNNRCELRADHPAHDYGKKSQWCDGYVTNPDKRKQQRDIDTVKRVADRENAQRVTANEPGA